MELGVIYLCVVAVVFVFQRSMEYFPDPRPLPSTKEAGVPEMSPVQVTTEDGLTLTAWFAPPKHKDGKIVVLFHGNGGNAAMRSDKARVFLDRGYGVYLCEYRGYGGNPGSPTEQGLYSDGRAAFVWLAGQGYSKSQFVIYGESLGSGVAVEMAKEMQPKYLILEGAFSSAADVAKDSMYLMPVDLLMHDRFDSKDKIADVKASLLMVHGKADTIVPIKFGHRLFDIAHGPKKFYEIDGGGHVNLYDFNAGSMIADWLDKQVAAGKGT